MVIECGDDGFGTDQRTVADCYAALVLKLTAGIDKYVFAELQIFSAIGIKRRKHVRSLGKLSAGQPLHQQLYFFRRVIGVVQLCLTFIASLERKVMYWCTSLNASTSAPCSATS